MDPLVGAHRAWVWVVTVVVWAAHKAAHKVVPLVAKVVE